MPAYQSQTPSLLRRFSLPIALIPLVFGCLFWLNGCGKTDDSQKTETKTADAGKTKTPVVKAPPVEKKPDPKKVWAEGIAKVQAHLSADELDEAAAGLESLETIHEEPNKPSDEQLAERDALKNQLDEKRKTLVAMQRETDLAEAERLMTIGKFTEATQKVNDVIAAVPTTEQREKTRVILAEVDSRRKAYRDLRTWVQLLEKNNKQNISTAHSKLLRQPDVALGMMIEASENVEKPILAANALEVLRMLNRPKEAIPALIAVLKRSEQQEIWPVAVRELGRIDQPGAGEELLELVLASEDSLQRIAALDSLANVVDIPNRTFTALLPWLLEDRPELAAALRTAGQAIHVHDQRDLISQRGFEAPLTSAQVEQVAQLPGRLTTLLDNSAGDEEKAEVAHAAKVLALMTHQVAPQPLENVKVLRADAEYPDAPATAVLDGVWNTTDLTKIWRHPVTQRSTITLDLGETKTVTGVRIWNFNQASGSQRGWKELEVFVSDSPTSLKPVAVGILPRAPGAENPPDYSSVVPVNFIKGRYVRLYAKSLWVADTYTGLSEIQVLGF